MTDIQKIKAGSYVASLLAHMTDGKPIEKKPDDLSWREIFLTAKHHSLALLCLHYLEDTVRSEADEKTVAEWMQEREIYFIQALKQKDEFSRIVAAFTEHKLSFMPLKGFLLRELYPRAEFRQMTDMDIYVSLEQTERAAEILSGMGYKRGVNYEVDLSMMKPPFVHVELHKYLFPGSTFTFSDAVPKAENPYWYLMKDEDFYVYLVQHMYKHYIHGGSGLRTLLDLYLYERAHPELDMGRVMSLLGEGDIITYYETVRELINHIFKGGKDSAAVRELFAYTVIGGAYGTLTNLAEYVVKKKGKAGFVLSRIFPPARLIKNKYRWVKKCPILLPVGYVVRFFDSIFNGRAKTYMTALSKSQKRDKSE